MGSRNKYEVDHATHRIRLDRTLFTATQYPADYGFIDDTLGLDSDPLDALSAMTGAYLDAPWCQVADFLRNARGVASALSTALLSSPSRA